MQSNTYTSIIIYLQLREKQMYIHYIHTHKYRSRYCICLCMNVHMHAFVYVYMNICVYINVCACTFGNKICIQHYIYDNKNIDYLKTLSCLMDIRKTREKHPNTPKLLFAGMFLVKLLLSSANLELIQLIYFLFISFGLIGDFGEINSRAFGSFFLKELKNKFANFGLKP